MRYLILMASLMSSCDSPTFNAPEQSGQAARAQQTPVVQPSAPAIPQQTSPLNPWTQVNPVPPNVDPTKVPREFTWGGDSDLWHIGDDNWDGSKCKLILRFNKLDSTGVVRFKFHVRTGTATMRIMLKHCGAEQNYPNEVVVRNSSTGQDVVPVRGVHSHQVTSSIPKLETLSERVSLPQGSYEIYVKSGVVSGDTDDFLVNARLRDVVGDIYLDPLGQ